MPKTIEGGREMNDRLKAAATEPKTYRRFCPDCKSDKVGLWAVKPQHLCLYCIKCQWEWNERLIKPELDIESAADELDAMVQEFSIEPENCPMTDKYLAILSEHFTQSQGVDVEALTRQIDNKIADDGDFYTEHISDIIRESLTDIVMLKMTAEIFSMENEMRKVRIAELEKGKVNVTEKSRVVESVLEEHSKTGNVGLIHSLVASTRELLSVLKEGAK